MSSVPIAHAGRGEEGVSSGMLGMVLFIASEAMFFAGLFGAYFFIRAQADSWPPEGFHTLEVPFPLVNTAILLLSGVTAHFATVALRQDRRKGWDGFVSLTALTIVLGTIFILGQAYEYSILDFGPEDGAFGSTFFITTGFHGAHVLGGLGMLVFVLVRALYGDFSSRRNLVVEATTAYWHFVDVVWVALFVVWYLT
ncbi:MAG: heme-copper oxidase subunit III [Dehalococcoidia bacterium]|nr:heme-copper oxidase subunit III [Dehalococcoidia bacterium]